MEITYDRGISRRGIPWITALAGTAAVLLLATIPPFVGPRAGALVMAAFSTVCHQLPERTFHIAGAPLAVCSRCLGIYAGLTAGVAFYPLGRFGRMIARYAAFSLFIALAVPGIDWLAGVAGIWHSGHSLRLVTGAFFGVVGGTLIARAAVKLGGAKSEDDSGTDGR